MTDEQRKALEARGWVDVGFNQWRWGDDLWLLWSEKDAAWSVMYAERYVPLSVLLDFAAILGWKPSGYVMLERDDAVFVADKLEDTASDLECYEADGFRWAGNDERADECLEAANRCKRLVEDLRR